MNRSIRERAIDPLQYDRDELLWSEEGHGLSPIRRVFLEKLQPHFGDLIGKDVLDVGCGQGWLSHNLVEHGARVTAIDPSVKNIKAATSQFRDVRFVKSSLQDFRTDHNYDLITAVMVFEHLPKLEESLSQIKGLLNAGGRLLTIIGDFDKFTQPRHGYTVDTEEISHDEVATRTDYGERSGVMYDINRTIPRFTCEADKAGFLVSEHEPMPAPDWLVDEVPRYSVHNGEPLFHLLELTSDS